MRRRGPSGVVVRYVLLAIVNALGVYGLITLAGLGMWRGFAAMLVGLVAVDVVYATGRFIPMKYFMPGLVLLLVYQIYVVLFTAQASLTNSSEFNAGTKQEAIAGVLARYERRVPDSTTYRVTLLDKGGALAMLVTDPQGKVEVGDADDPLKPADGATLDATGKATGLGGYTTLSYADLATRTDDIVKLRVPISSDPGAGSLRTPDGANAFVYKPDATYADGKITTPQGTYVADDQRGNFVNGQGEELRPGWKVFVGLDNYKSVLTDKDIRGPFLGVLIWTFVFAGISTLGSFALGLITAMVLNDRRVKGQRLYRSLLLMPYAIPAVITAGVFRGMFNTEFGFINQVLLFGASPDWLGNAWLAKVTLILVNLWLGYPYMFLVATGALQAMPEDVVEASLVDGATAWQAFWRVKLHFILAATLPLLIASFAFNFNNFTLIAALTDGGPPDTGAAISVGHTDILITLVYNLAFGGEQARYGYASAVSILIFLFVATISVIGFRRTKKYEEA